MKKITSKQNRLNAKTVLALGVFLISALFVSQAQTETIEIDVFPPSVNLITPANGVPVTMTSAVMDHPDGGTYTVSFDVHIADGATFYAAGQSVDDAPTSPRYWGLTANKWFDGSNQDKTENIDNIQVTIINDLGTLVGSDFTDTKFVSANIGQGDQVNDSGYFLYNGATANADKDTWARHPSLTDFVFGNAGVAVTSFNVGTNSGLPNNELGGNKWGVRSVKISVTYNVSTAGTQNFSDLLESGYKLYPNPASNNITVESEAGATITISSIVGASVLEISNATEVQQINTSSLAKGVYLVRVNNAVSKLIIE